MGGVGTQVEHLLVPHAARQRPGTPTSPSAATGQLPSLSAVTERRLTYAGLEQDLEGSLVWLPAHQRGLDGVDQHGPLREHLVPAAQQLDADGETESPAGHAGHCHEAVGVRHGVERQVAVCRGDAGTGDVAVGQTSLQYIQ